MLCEITKSYLTLKFRSKCTNFRLNCTTFTDYFNGKYASAYLISTCIRPVF